MSGRSEIDRRRAFQKWPKRRAGAGTLLAVEGVARWPFGLGRCRVALVRRRLAKLPGRSGAVGWRDHEALRGHYGAALIFLWMALVSGSEARASS